MNKRLLTVIALMLILICTITACNEGNDPQSREHDWHTVTTDPASDADNHWYKCTVCDATKKEKHIVTGSGTCSVCNVSISPTEGIIYSTSSDKTYAEVVGYTGTKKNILIASEYNGLPVKTIYKDSFKNTSITAVAIPDSVATIGDSAFYGCESLTRVSMGNGVTTIDESAFCYCRALTSITIPDSVTTIGDSAFYYCMALTSITIPDSVTTISELAFGRCNLTDVYYSASKEKWDSITISSSNKALTEATIHYNYTQQKLKNRLYGGSI